MKSIQSVVTDAIDEVLDENVDTNVTTRKITNRVVKRLGEHNHIVATWLIQQGVFKLVGFTSHVRPKNLSPVAITRNHVKVFTVDPDKLKG
jgi:hypothetical protein